MSCLGQLTHNSEYFEAQPYDQSKLTVTVFNSV